MLKFEIEYTEEQLKAVNYFVGDGKKWLQTAWNQKAELRTNAAIMEKTDRNPKKINNEEKISLIKSLDLPAREINQPPSTDEE